MTAQQHARLCEILSKLPEVLDGDELSDLSVMGCGIPVEDWYYPQAEQVAAVEVIKWKPAQLQAAA